MEIKEVRVTEEGFEVTLSWSIQEVEDGSNDYGWWLRSLIQQPDRIRLMDVLVKKLDEAEENYGRQMAEDLDGLHRSLEEAER